MPTIRQQPKGISMNGLRSRRLVLVAVTIPLVLAACGDDEDDPGSPATPTEVTATDDTMSDDTMSDDTMSDDTMSDDTMSDDTMSDDTMSDDTMSDDTMSDDTMSDDTISDDTILESAPIDLPAWQTAELTDVDGESFTLSDYIGTPVLVESFATWCSKCLAQLGDTQAAAAEVGDEAAVVALSVETDLDPSVVADYAADNRFGDIRFAVLTPEALAALADDLGTSVANPPATPKVVIDASGEAGELTTGAESTDAIVAALRAAA